MTAPRRASRLAGLTPDELELLALGHLAEARAELRAGRARLRHALSPARVAARHPVLLAAALGAAGYLILRPPRRARRAPPPPPLLPPGPAAAAGPPESIGHAAARSFLSALAGAAARALPGLVSAWLARGPRSG